MVAVSEQTIQNVPTDLESDCIILTARARRKCSCYETYPVCHQRRRRSDHLEG